MIKWTNQIVPTKLGASSSMQRLVVFVTSGEPALWYDLQRKIDFNPQPPKEKSLEHQII